MADVEGLQARPFSPSTASPTLNGRASFRRPGLGARTETSDTIRTLGPLKLRGEVDDLPQRWWFASMAIPLLAATIGPLSNVLSIAALVSPWRVTLPNHGELPEGTDDNGIGITDPQWEIILNGVSLAAGFIGNIFLLLNFTGRVRYIIALPLSITFWILASWILIAAIISMHRFLPAVPPGETYSQGFWHAVLASILYSIGSGMLLANMVGYFRGHYPQTFDLDDHQRTLIVQTMMFFFWLAGGAGIFCKIEGLTFANAIYFADISILTIGFGDIYPRTDAGRGFLFVFQLFGIIFLGLVIKSISRFASSISADKIVRGHQEHARASTFGRTVTNEHELRERLGLPPRRVSSTPGPGVGVGVGVGAAAAAAAAAAERRRQSMNKYGRLEIVGRTVTFHRADSLPVQGGGRGGAARRNNSIGGSGGGGGDDDSSQQAKRRQRRRQKLLLLREERDRFEAMREIQDRTRRFKQYWALGMAFLAFGVLWCLGALVFMLTEQRLVGLSYFQALYFCFVSLLTIGYGDFSPKSNVGKPFFIVWSLIAVPTMTILIQEMSKTVFQAVNRGTFRLADWPLLLRKGAMKEFLDNHPRLREWVRRYQERRRVRRGFQVQNWDEELGAVSRTVTIDATTELGVSMAAPTAHSTPEATVSAAAADKNAHPGGHSQDRHYDDHHHPDHHHHHDLARQLAQTIKMVAHDLRASPPKRYTYEEWVRFTRLIRFSSQKSRHHPGPGQEAQLRRDGEGPEDVEEDQGTVLTWDWIGEDSPMLADVTEAEWVLDRLCESLNRYTRAQVAAGSHLHTQQQHHHHHRSLKGMVGGNEVRRPKTIPEAENDGGGHDDEDNISSEVTSPLSFDHPEVKEWSERLKRANSQGGGGDSGR